MTITLTLSTPLDWVVALTMGLCAVVGSNFFFSLTWILVRESRSFWRRR